MIGGGCVPTWTNAGKAAASSAASAATPRVTSDSSKNAVSAQVCQPRKKRQRELYEPADRVYRCKLPRFVGALYLDGKVATRPSAPPHPFEQSAIQIDPAVLLVGNRDRCTK